MIRRKHKITALLLAATSIITLTPAMALNSTPRLETKDGTIENAVAYKDGKYIYQGYKSDDDDNSIYYNNGDKDRELDDLDDSDLNGAYADKYAFANDGDDQYLVDLTNGSVTDDDTPEDDADTAATKLKTALKKTDRYGSNVNEGSLSNTDLGYIDEDTTGVLPGNKFNYNWYQYKVIPESGADGENNTIGGYLYGFTNGSGKYIDTCNLANIYAYSSIKGKYVKIEEFSNNADDVDDDTGLLATLVSKPEVLTQDADYIYAKVKVQIYDENAKEGDTVGTTTTAAAVGVTANKGIATNHTYIQKISKTRGDQKDDAYLPKTVTSYEVTSGILDSEDADDAASAIDRANSFTVVNGQLLAIENTASGSSDGNVEVTSINLKKDKVKFETEPNSVTSSKVDVYLAEKDDSDDIDIDTEYSVDTDIDGNVWAVSNGKIYKFTNDEFTKFYTTDSSLDALSVYDENSMIAWEYDGDIYATVNEEKSESTEEVTSAPTSTAKVGWDQLADGTWNFYDATGTKVYNNWINVSGTWYFLNSNGTMVTGWQEIYGFWYYFNPISDGTKGAMKTGWINDNGKLYYLNPNGTMATGWANLNSTWYYFNPVSTGTKGAMKTGWINANGNWYYLYENGAMAANTRIGGYILSSSGALI